MTTRIYTAGNKTTAPELVAMTHVEVDDWFPELFGCDGETYPVHPHDLIKLVPGLRGHTIVTMSDVVILWFLREIRHSRMRPEDLELYCDGTRLYANCDGELADPWGEMSFFRCRGHLLFD